MHIVTTLLIALELDEAADPEPWVVYDNPEKNKQRPLIDADLRSGLASISVY